MRINPLYQCGIVQLSLVGAAFFSSCESQPENANLNTEQAEDNVLGTIAVPKNVVPFEPEEIKYVLTVHELYDMYSKETDVTEVNSFSGGTVRVVTGPLVSSIDMTEVEAQPRPNHEGFCNLKVTFTPNGREKWDQLSRKYGEKELALLIDGEFYRLFRPREFPDDESCSAVIVGPIDNVTAKNIALYSRYNHTEIERMLKRKERN